MLKIVDKPDLPKEYFQVVAKPQLLAQAVRVYLANQRQGTQSALTRADVNRTRKKVFRQKGTGHARHGDRKSPIFVGGGVAFAPKPRDYRLALSSRIKARAKAAALSAKVAAGKLLVAEGLVGLTGKTKELAAFLANTDKQAGNWLVITDKLRPNVYRAGRNLTSATVWPWNQVSAYQILRADTVVLMSEAVTSLSGTKAKKQPKPKLKTKS